MARLLDDASSEYLRVEDAPVSGLPYAMVLWFYADDTVWGVPFHMGDDAAQYTYLTCRGDSGPQFQAQCRSGVAMASTNFSINTWHHGAGVFVSTTDRRCLLDGGSKGVNTTDITSLGTQDSTVIGARNSYGYSKYFSGRVAEAAVYDLSVWPGATDSDKADNFEAIALPVLAKGYSPLHIPLGLAAYWPLIRDEDQDRIGGYDLTAYNTPSIATHPAIIYPAPMIIGVPTAAAGAQSVILTALTLAGSAGGLAVSPGAVAIVMNALTLAGSSGSFTVSPGAVAVVLAALTLGGSVTTMSVSPGAVQLAMSALTLAGTAATSSVSPGAVALVVSALTLAGSAGGLTVSLGAAYIAMAALTLAGTAGTISVVPGAIQIALSALSLVSSVEASSILAGVVSLLMSALTLTGTAESFTIVPGATSVTMSALSLAGSAENLTASTGLIVALAALALAGSAGGLTVSPGAVSVLMNWLSLAGSAEGLTISPGEVIILLNALSLASQASALVPRLGAIVYGETIGLVSDSVVLGLIIDAIVKGRMSI